MANFFDQFDPAASSGNYFDQFHNDEPKPGFDAADVAKSAGIGVVKGGIGLAGLPADLGELGARGIDAATQYFGGKLGFDPSSLKRPALPQGAFSLPGSNAIQKGVENLTGEFYKPKSTAGEYAQTIGEFAPAAVGGPGSWLARGARAVVPAVASEAAGQATKGTAAEPYIRAGAAVLSGGVTSLLQDASRTSAARAGASRMTADEIRDAARQNYQDARATGLELRPQPVAQVARDIETQLTDVGLTARNVPETYGVLRNLQNPPRGAVMRATDFESARQELVQARQNVANRREIPAANMAIDALDNYLANIPAPHVLRGDAAAASRLFDQGRRNWAAASRADMIAGKFELGDLNAATAHSGQNIDNATRQSVKQLIRPDNNGRTKAQKAGFNAEEIALMNRVARGTTTGNVMRFIGKMAPTNSINASIHGGAAGLSGGATIPLSVASYLAKRVGDASTSRSANMLAQAVANRAPHAAALPAPPTSNHAIQALINAILASQGSEVPLGFPMPSQLAR